jgi:hypothetical protein
VPAPLVVGKLAPQLERASGRGREIDRRLCKTAAAQCVERPDDARRTDVEVLQRRRRELDVPLLGRPEPLRVEGRVRIGGDPADSVADTTLVPRFVSKRLVELRVVQHTRMFAPGASP